MHTAGLARFSDAVDHRWINGLVKNGNARGPDPTPKNSLAAPRSLRCVEVTAVAEHDWPRTWSAGLELRLLLRPRENL